MSDDTANLEAIESQGFAAWFDAADRARVDGLDWRRELIGDASCYVSPGEPSILANRVLGLGSREAPSLQRLVRIRELYADAGVGRFFLHVVPEIFGPDREELLSAAGYTRYRGWMKFIRGVDTGGPVRTDLAVRRIGHDRAGEFAVIAGDAFGFGAAFHPAIAALSDATGWKMFMSFAGEKPAGTGALFVHGDIATLDFGATRPDFRRRGGQSALLRERIRAARQAGCRKIVTMTGEAVAGEEQHSYRNIERAGFTAAYVRENWIPTGS